MDVSWSPGPLCVYGIRCRRNGSTDLHLPLGPPQVFEGTTTFRGLFTSSQLGPWHAVGGPVPFSVFPFSRTRLRPPEATLSSSRNCHTMRRRSVMSKI